MDCVRRVEHEAGGQVVRWEHPSGEPETDQYASGPNYREHNQ